MNAHDFRRIVLGFDGAYEHAHMGHPDFRAANGKIFATLTDDERRGMASLTPEQQAEFLARAPRMFVPAAGAWGRSGSTMIVLEEADQETVGEAVTLAWQRISAGPAAKKKAKVSRAPKAKRRSVRATAAPRKPAASRRPVRKRR
jgi:hypothetical protein